MQVYIMLLVCIDNSWHPEGFSNVKYWIHTACPFICVWS